MMVEVWGAAQAHPRLHHALAGYLDELVDEVTDSPFLPGWVRRILWQGNMHICVFVRVVCYK